MKIILVKMERLRMFDSGWGNGYVVLNETHPLFGKGYDDIHTGIEVHGGITFSEYITENTIERFTPPDTGTKEIDECHLSKDDIGKWLIGFDTAHLGDTKENWPVNKVFEEAKKLKLQLENYANLRREDSTKNLG